MRPWHVAVMIYLGLVAATVAATVARVGRWAYPLDDAYIHLAMARSVAEHGVWGITPDGFTSSTSSPLWTILLSSAYRVVPSIWVPLVLTLASGILLLWLLDRFIVPSGEGAFGPRVGALTAIVVLAPLTALTTVGMEHMLHAAVAIAFVGLGVRVIHERTSQRVTWAWIGLAAVMTATRYEGLFLVGIFAGILVLRQRPLGAAVLGAGLAPVVGYGLWSQANGYAFLPNSISLKGDSTVPTSPGEVYGFVARFVVRFLSWNPLSPLMVLFAAWYAVRWRKGQVPWHEAGQLMLGAWVVAAGAHLQFARLGWFYRYETYLLVLAMAIVARLVVPHAGRVPAILSDRRTKAIAVVALLAFAPTMVRGVAGDLATPRGAHFIATQQLVMADYLDAHHAGEVVAVNDIGAVALLADVTLLDTWGLADNTVADAKRDGTYNAQWLASYAHSRNASVAIIYDFWLEPWGGVPVAWTQVAQWTAPAGPPAQRTVSIYAIGLDAGEVAQRVRSYEISLPDGVVATYA